VQRILPNRIRVELTERTPVALREMATTGAIDAHGGSSTPPAKTCVPIVSGVSEICRANSAKKRMQIYGEFMKDVDLARRFLRESQRDRHSESKGSARGMTGLSGPAILKPCHHLA